MQHHLLAKVQAFKSPYLLEKLLVPSHTIVAQLTDNIAANHKDNILFSCFLKDNVYKGVCKIIFHFLELSICILLLTQHKGDNSSKFAQYELFVFRITSSCTG